MKCRTSRWQFWRKPHKFRVGLFGRLHLCVRCHAYPSAEQRFQAKMQGVNSAASQYWSG